jgi:translation initiation factor 1
VRLRRDRTRVTIVEGIDSNDIDLEDLGKKLKTACASGGTVKDDRIELQGDHKRKVKKVLNEMGFNVEEK